MTQIEEIRAHVRANYKTPSPLADFARDVGVSLPHLYRLFNGKRAPSQKTRQRIHELTGIDIAPLEGAAQ